MADGVDLSLVSVEDLKEELFRRCDQGALIVMNRTEDAGDPVVQVATKGGLVQGIGLAHAAITFLTERLMENSEF